MHFIRFFGVSVGLGLAYIISTWSEIELFKVLSILSFVLIADSLICKYIAYLYMKSVMREMNLVEEETEKRDDRNTGN